MATAKRAKAKAEPKQLKLVCKCGSCTHWEIVLKFGGAGRESEALVCVNCGLEASCYFSIGPHEGLHYERHTKGDEKKACSTKS
jgi:hypothetical protein